MHRQTEQKANRRTGEVGRDEIGYVTETTSKTDRLTDD